MPLLLPLALSVLPTPARDWNQRCTTSDNIPRPGYPCVKAAQEHQRENRQHGQHGVVLSEHPPAMRPEVLAPDGYFWEVEWQDDEHE